MIAVGPKLSDPLNRFVSKTQIWTKSVRFWGSVSVSFLYRLFYLDGSQRNRFEFNNNVGLSVSGSRCLSKHLLFLLLKSPPCFSALPVLTRSFSQTRSIFSPDESAELCCRGGGGGWECAGRCLRERRQAETCQNWLGRLLRSERESLQEETHYCHCTCADPFSRWFKVTLPLKPPEEPRGLFVCLRRGSDF